MIQMKIKEVENMNNIENKELYEELKQAIIKDKKNGAILSYEDFLKTDEAKEYTMKRSIK